MKKAYVSLEVDLQKVKEFILSDNFIQYLLNNMTDVGIVGFIIQSVLNEIERIEGE